MSLLSLSFSASLVALLFALPAQAQNLEKQDFDLYVGGSALYHPDYLGSDDYDVGFAPDAELTWQKTLFISTKRGAGVYIVDYPTSKFGVSVVPDFGRDESSSSQLTGLGDIDLGWQARIFGDFAFDPFIAGAEARIGFGGDAEGQLVNAYFGLHKDLMPKLMGQMTVGTTWASRSSNNTWYGVSTAQSVSSGLAAFDPGSGFRNVSVGSMLSYDLTRSVALTGTARWDHLLGDVADSPIVTEEDNLTVGVGLKYQLYTNRIRPSN